MSDDRLRYRANYKFMGAMRGPDFSSPEWDHVKQVVVSRLRSLAFSGSECRGYHSIYPIFRSEADALVRAVERIHEKMSLGRFEGWEHYWTHLIDALREVDPKDAERLNLPSLYDLSYAVRGGDLGPIKTWARKSPDGSVDQEFSRTSPATSSQRA